MKLANLIVGAHARVGIATEKGYAILPEGMPETIEQIICAGKEISDALKGIKPQWLEEIPAHRARFAPAVEKGRKLLMVGVNYRAHAEECNEQSPSYPVIFGKFSNALAASGDTVHPPLATSQLDYEAELVVIIGKECRNVSEQEAEKYIFGYTCGNDFSARDLQFRTPQWCSGKSADGFAPVGPVVVTRDSFSPDDARIECRVNGEVRQSATTKDMIHSPRRIVSYLSTLMTLEVGDAIFTGTPAGVVLGLPENERVWLKEGDEVEVEIEGIGVLRNTVGASCRV